MLVRIGWGGAPVLLGAAGLAPSNSVVVGDPNFDLNNGNEFNDHSAN